MRKLARKRGLHVYDAVAERLPFESEQFDFVLMVTTICFLDDIRTSFIPTLLLQTALPQSLLLLLFPIAFYIHQVQDARDHEQGEQRGNDKTA